MIAIKILCAGSSEIVILKVPRHFKVSGEEELKIEKKIRKDEERDPQDE